MKTRITVTLFGLTLGLIMLTACTTTKEMNEWRAANSPNIRIGHIMIVALFKQDETRRQFEDEFAWQISNQGQMVTRSYNLVPSLNEYTTDRIATIAQAVGADGILAVRMLKGNPPAADNKIPHPMKLAEFLQYSWKDNYEPPTPMTNTAMTVESRLFDAKTGKPIWSLLTESQNQLGMKLEIELLVKRVLGRIKSAMRAN